MSTCEWLGKHFKSAVGIDQAGGMFKAGRQYALSATHQY